MEENLVPSAVTDHDGVEVDDFIYKDGTSFGGERCGICMDIIIDRGVLDCCQHWFCFGCIDNWATITNLCPLCQNEFQLITCVPVYDTIGSSKNDDDSYCRADDWFIEGKNNTLSFPSYYIDENAVICLDGDGCKIRNGLAAIEGDSNLDTSIACDSCDLWYHAFCVGFDPESTSENTWLCPRCIVDEMPQKSDGNLGNNYNNFSGSENSNRGHLVEDTYSRKMSVSVADSGETALVVSMVGGDKLTEETLDNIGQAVEVNTDLKTQAFMLTSKDDVQKQITPSEENSAAQPISNTRELELSLSCDTSLSVCSNCLIEKELVTSTDKSVNYHGCSSGFKSSEEFSNELHVSNNPSGSGFDTGLRLCLSVGSVSSEVNRSVTEDQMNEELDQLDPVEECKPTDQKSVPEADEDALVTNGVKRKHLDYSSSIRDNTHAGDNGDSKTEIENEATPKKMRVDERTRPISPIDQVNLSASNDSNIASAEQNNGTADIMSIVQGTKRRPSKGPKHTSTGDKLSKEVESSGLRVKKIMKRATEEDKDSSTVVQNLRKQIREAVRNNKSVKDLGEENLFDPKLLAAFRAAVSGPKTEPNKALSQLGIKARKSMLQKGKVRENLTKKIYGLSNGRRKRAWDRDCEVEFWKHRCLRASRPEKIQTLESVLDLLKNDSEGTENGQRSKDPILSRLYLADTSVFPRKDDIKPLAALKTSADLEPSNKQNEKRLKPSLDCSNSQVIGSSKVEKKSSKSAPREEKIVKPPDVKVDKKKWALEVLARRTAGGAGDKSVSERNEDNAVLNGNYRLLAQLPVEMRPVLAVSRHNKIPMSVRQAQLYRLTEHLLRKANLPEIRRNAETELAVADAINIEREVADRSNSKPVYINLCAQELLLHRFETNKPSEEDPQPIENDPEQPEPELLTGPTVEEALRNAGLVSDSPQNSPENEGPDDVFEMDNTPDLDIFGEFEYSLDEEDYIGNSSTSQVSKVQLNPEEYGSKLKLVFSTLGSDKPESESPNSVEPRVPKEGPLLLLGKEGEEVSIAECEELYGPDKEPNEPLSENLIVDVSMKLGGLGDEKSGSIGRNSSGGESSPYHSEIVENSRRKVEKKSSVDNPISKKVEAYVKEHVRPLCKSGIITADQYRWAVAKTTEKVMKYHSKAKNANFLIKEGDKVKRLSEQYVEAAKQKDKAD